MQADDSFSQGRFAAAAFTHQGQGVAAVDGKAHSIHGMDYLADALQATVAEMKLFEDILLYGKMFYQIFDFQQRQV